MPRASLRATRRRVAELEAEVERLAPMEAELLNLRARMASLPGDVATLVAVAVDSIRRDLADHVNDDLRHLPRKGGR